MLSIRQTRRGMRGVTLIELMIALVVGLIVSGAALAFVVAVMKSNAETIKATRLTQELRTTAEIIARDLRRARSVTDPVYNVGLTPVVSSVCNTITPTVATGPGSCVTFGYDCDSASQTGTFKSIGLAAGKVRLTTSAGAAAAPACPTAASAQVSSDIITITGLTITAKSADAYTLALTGRFTNDPSTTSPLVRSFTQEVRIRSSRVN